MALIGHWLRATIRKIPWLILVLPLEGLRRLAEDRLVGWANDQLGMKTGGFMHVWPKLVLGFVHHPWAPVVLVAIAIMLFALVREAIQEERTKKHPDSLAVPEQSLWVSVKRAVLATVLLFAAIGVLTVIFPKKPQLASGPHPTQQPIAISELGKAPTAKNQSPPAARPHTVEKPKIESRPKHRLRAELSHPEPPASTASTVAPAPVVPPLTCTDCNQAGVNNGEQNTYNFRNPLPKIKVLSKSPIAAQYMSQYLPFVPPQVGQTPANPGASATIELGGTFYNPGFTAKCSVPCKFIRASVIENGTEKSDNNNRSLTSSDRMTAGVLYNSGMLPSGSIIDLVFESLDNRPLEISNIQPIAPSH